ncbi:hypothetical protein ACLOJK_020806 [Asimina triloba]
MRESIRGEFCSVESVCGIQRSGLLWGVNVNVKGEWNADGFILIGFDRVCHITTQVRKVHCTVPISFVGAVWTSIFGYKSNLSRSFLCRAELVSGLRLDGGGRRRRQQQRNSPTSRLCGPHVFGIRAQVTTAAPAAVLCQQLVIPTFHLFCLSDVRRDMSSARPSL